MTRALAIAALAASTLCTGCIFVGSSDSTRNNAVRITRPQMDDLIAQTRQLRVGMSRDEALALYPAEHLNLKSSTTAEGSVFEEWQVEAYARSQDVYFRRYLYFANNTLAAFSDSRLDYRDNQDVLRGWAGR